MSQKVLFVDDETMILNGLKRMLRSMRSEWEMEFVDGGEKALELMEQEAFDVIVTDMRMPGMNGAELLEKVMEVHPETVRLILSGYADHELIMKSVGATHQYLAKPCDADDLKSTINRTMSMKGTHEGVNVFEIVSSMVKIPSLPTLYLEIMEKLRDPESEISDISKIVSRDIGMTTNILKLVNSAFFGLSRKMADIDEAVSHLGLNLLKNLVLVTEIFAKFDKIVEGLSPSNLWMHCQEVADIAKRILEMEGSASKEKEVVFVAAMLHDVGKLILYTNFPEEYCELLNDKAGEGSDLSQREKEVFGASHAEVGSYLLGLWGLDEKIVDAIAFHHQPSESLSEEFGTPACIHAANVISNDLHASKWGGSVQPDEVYLAKIGVAERYKSWREEVRNAV